MKITKVFKVAGLCLLFLGASSFANKSANAAKLLSTSSNPQIKSVPEQVVRERLDTLQNNINKIEKTEDIIVQGNSFLKGVGRTAVGMTPTVAAGGTLLLSNVLSQNPTPTGGLKGKKIWFITAYAVLSILGQYYLQSKYEDWVRDYTETSLNLSKQAKYETKQLEKEKEVLQSKLVEGQSSVKGLSCQDLNNISVINGNNLAELKGMQGSVDALEAKWQHSEKKYKLTLGFNTVLDHVYALFTGLFVEAFAVSGATGTGSKFSNLQAIGIPLLADAALVGITRIVENYMFDSYEYSESRVAFADLYWSVKVANDRLTESQSVYQDWAQKYCGNAYNK